MKLTEEYFPGNGNLQYEEFRRKFVDEYILKDLKVTRVAVSLL